MEETLINRYHYGCDIGCEDMLLQIPKRKNKLKSGSRVVGCGLPRIGALETKDCAHDYPARAVCVCFVVSM
jgi:hypothetical protein